MVVRLQRGRALIVAAVGGVLFAATAPPTNIYPAVLIGLAFLAASLALPPAPKRASDEAPAELGFWRAFGRGALWGTAAGVVGLRFVPAVIQRFTPLGSAASYLSLVLLAAGQSLIWALGAGIAAVARRRARVPFEIAFALGVFVAVSLPTIFAWTPAGLLSPWPVFVQLADVIGERGVSALFAAGVALFVRAAFALVGASVDPAAPPAPLPLRARIDASVLRPALGAVAFFALLALHGALRMRSIRAEGASLPTLRVGLVDQAVDPKERWKPENFPAILLRLRELTQRLEAEGAELVVWPEAAYPYSLEHDARHAPRGPTALLSSRNPRVRGPLLIGLITREKPFVLPSGEVEYNSYNSATLITPDGAMQAPHDKLQLLWFGEMVPLGAELPWLRRLFQRSGGLIPGTAARALTLPRTEGRGLPMAVLNCYEDTLASVGRRLVNELGPSLLVNVTNDAWFYGTAEPALHARLAAMRAIELRLDLVRAVNMGVASWIDATGEVRAAMPNEAGNPATMMVEPAIRARAYTFYARLGDTPLMALFALSIAGFTIRARRRARGRSAAE